MTEVTNSTCDSDVSVSDYSGAHVPHQSCRGMHLSKNLIWRVGVHVPVPAWARAWERALVFPQGLMWDSGYPAGGVLDTDKLNSACSLGASPRQLWGLCVGCRGGRRESTAVSPAWAALLQCHKGRALHLLWLRGWQGTPAACFRSFGVLRGSATERFLCAASLGRLSSNGLTRYL